MSKDLLFYSNFCEFSKEIIGILIKQNIRNNFLLVCVDTRKFDIPRVIDHVPAILRPNTGEVITEENLYKYLESITVTTKQNTEISPMLSVYGNTLYSSSFSSLMEDEVSEDKNYVFLGNEVHIPVAPDENQAKAGGSFDSSAFEKYLEMRKSDDSYMKKILDSNQSGNRLL